MTDLAGILDVVAKAILDDLLDPSKELTWNQRIDAFKVVSAYLLSLRKQSDKDKSDDDPAAPSFDKWRARANGGVIQNEVAATAGRRE